MNYCPGDRDDVVAHEWGKRYTAFTGVITSGSRRLQESMRT